MRSRTFRISFLVLGLAALASLCLVLVPRESGREAFVRHCNEEGAGGMFTSRDYCEALYSKSIARPSRKAG
jgi:hypothetical protein